MNKKEVAEIKKQFTPDKSPITRITGCYVNGEKEKLTTFRTTFLMIDEEEQFKYFELIRKCLSGTVGRNMVNMEFPLEQEREGGTQHFLMKLRESELKDDELLDQYYDKIIENLYLPENYLILTLHAVYDVPGRTKDNLDMDDASDEVFTFLMSCVCPVALAKPALSYDDVEKEFHNRLRDWVVGMPMIGFTFPAFNDRSTDIHNLLYYTKTPDNLHTDFTDTVLGCQVPMGPGDQKEVFTQLIEDTLAEACDFDTVRAIHDKLHEITEEAKESPDPVMLDQVEVKNLLEISGANKEKMETFDENYEKTAGEHTEFLATNVMSARKFEVRTPDVVIQVSPDRSDLVEKQFIDGRPCLVIPITDEVTVNGIRVKADLPGRIE